ncbi:hypothetical protein J7432_06915 [Xanthomonas axonopodis pv. begoniae]|uniref:hypothetical protein n=1 Tax=Xanthomonas phaseoli TaxID=1985254 RepID=UPI000CEDA3ED|nr:hypothetical protein [Xanthomonas phaseoli]MBO9738763.1 hypothetical protein [Xanthomonas axonopodis pv. begoniae]MBO9771828.1 hypothetical protein [Xanthomonas axonopodis pv. begoniae]MCC8471303.1 hypothetical protein [Xanthomonas phaseoli]PPT38374.1 hypothetical protein XabCFBP2524_06000 [Xanthomonas axonopodis pv. begoniae]
MSYLFLQDAAQTNVVRAKGAPTHGMVPWGLTHDGRIVFAEKGVPAPHPGSKYSQYDKNKNIRRRVRFESYLAALVLLDPSPVMPAIRRLNSAIGDYLEERQMRVLRGMDSDGVDTKLAGLGAEIKTWLYNDELGRLGRHSEAPAEEDILIRALVAADHGSLQQMMNVHATVIGKIVPLLGYRDDRQRDIDLGNKARLKPASLFDSNRRGRRKRDKIDNRPYTTVGIQHRSDLARAHARTDPELATLLEPHPRAVGEFERDGVKNLPDDAPRRIDEQPFAASYSGSTTELIRLALLFGSFDKEAMRQYLLAVAAFLIGGGHHSFHEVMSIARLADVKYVDGAYDAMLPKSFKQTAWYEQLLEGFGDVLFSEYWPEVSLNFGTR